MTDYKLVSVEPTAEMVEAAQDAYMPFGDMEMAIRMALLAAPDHIADARKKVGRPQPALSRFLEKEEWADAFAQGFNAGFNSDEKPAPDVAALVEALEQCITSMLDSGYRADAVVIRAARSALAAHRKQGGEQ